MGDPIHYTENPIHYTENRKKKKKASTLLNVKFLQKQIQIYKTITLMNLFL